MDWLELFGSAEYELPLEIDPGSRFVGGANYPDAIVTASDLLYPRRFLIQRVDIVAENPETEQKQNIRIYRVAVETEDDDVVEIRRVAVPAEGPVAIDTSHCVACGGIIAEGYHVEVAGHAYHARCVREVSDGESVGPSSDCGLRRDSGDGRVGSDIGDTQTEEDAVHQAPARSSVTKLQTDEAGTPSHIVTVVSIGEDREAVTLWSRDLGSSSGTVVGRWTRGLFNGDLPRDCDADYIDEKFFGRAGVVTKADLLVWNRLYKEAFAEMHSPA